MGLQRNDRVTNKSKASIGELSPFKVLTIALSRVPGLKILFGVVAVLSILAMARVWSLDRGWTIVGGIAVVLFAFVLLVLAKFSASKKSEFRGPARVLMWFSVVLFIAWCSLLTSCVFFKWPVSVSDLPLSPAPKPPPGPSIISGSIIIDSRPASDRRDLKLTCDTDAGLSLEPAVLSGARFRVAVPPEVLSATVTARTGDRMGKVVFDLRSKEREKTITLEPVATGPQLLRTYAEEQLGPLDSVRTKDGNAISLSYSRPKNSVLRKITTFSEVITSSESITAFDAEATADPVFVDNAVVRVTHWAPPPTIEDVIMVLPLAHLHVGYVQIDTPSSTTEALFKAPFLSDSGPIYFSLRPDEPERFAIIAGATTPGIYTFDVGVECHSRDRRDLVWVASGIRVYFAGPEFPDVYAKSNAEKKKNQEVSELLKTDPAKVLLTKTNASSSDVEEAIALLTRLDPTAFAAAKELHDSHRFDNYSPLNGEIIKCIGRTGGESALPQLKSWLTSKKWQEPEAAVAALLQINTPPATAVLKSALAGKSTDNLVSALIEAATSQVLPTEIQAEALALVRKRLSNSTKYERSTALKALEKLLPDEAYSIANEWLRSSNDIEALQAAAEVCVSLNANDSLDLINLAIDRLNKDHDRSQLIPALCALAVEKDIPVLVAQLRKVSKDPKSADLVVGKLSSLTGQHMGFISETYGSGEDELKNKAKNEVVVARWAKWLQKRL